ncbi:MAG: AraC family transcriptional regulator [Halioglobus sp.]
MNLLPVHRTRAAARGHQLRLSGRKGRGRGGVGGSGKRPGTAAAISMRILCGVLLIVVGVYAASAQEIASAGDLNTRIQQIKQQALELNRDLAILEEELLVPMDSRMTVYLSMDVGDFLTLESVRLSIDGTQVTHYLYTPHQLAALRQGGVQRLYMGNVTAGNHQVSAVFTGKGGEGVDYERQAQLAVEKTRGAKNLELKITDPARQQQPEFTVQAW